MGRNQCGHLIPNDSIVAGKDTIGCLLPERHPGEHLSVCTTSWGSTEYYLWEYVEVCDCSEMTPEEIENGECECIFYRNISAEEATLMIMPSD